MIEKRKLGRTGVEVSVLTFGCGAVGDPACDLTIAWTLFQGVARETFRRDVALDDACWDRARGWALWKGMITRTRNDGDAEAARVIADVLAEAGS